MSVVSGTLITSDWGNLVENRLAKTPLNIDANLIIVNNSSNPTYQLDISWDRIFIGYYESTSFSDTIDITTDLDTGSEASSTMYYIHAMVGSGQTTICKFSASYNSPTLPANYTDSKLIGLVYNTSGSNFWTMSQKNKLYCFSGPVVLFNITLSGTTYFDLDLSTRTDIPNLSAVAKLNTEIKMRHNSSSPDIFYLYDYDGTTRIEVSVFYDRDATGGIYCQYIHNIINDQISINSDTGCDAFLDIQCRGFELNI